MSVTWLEVTDLVEFLQREESVSGVQRVIAETVPLLMAADLQARAVVLDRPRGVFVDLTAPEVETLLVRGATSASPLSRAELAATANACLERAHAAAPVAQGAIIQHSHARCGHALTHQPGKSRAALAVEIAL